MQWLKKWELPNKNYKGLHHSPGSCGDMLSSASTPRLRSLIGLSVRGLSGHSMKPTLGPGHSALPCLMKVVDYMIVCRGGVKLRLQRSCQRVMNTCMGVQQGEPQPCVNPPTCKSECPRKSLPWSRWAVRSHRSHTAWSPPGSSPGCWRVSHLKEEEVGRVFTMETSFYNEARVSVGWYISSHWNT